MVDFGPAISLINLTKRIIISLIEKPVLFCDDYDERRINK